MDNFEHKQEKKKTRIKYISKVPYDDIGFEKVKIKGCLELEDYPDGIWRLTNPHPTNVDLSLRKIHLKKVKFVLKDKGKYYILCGFPSNNHIRKNKSLTKKEYNLLKTIPKKFLNKKTLTSIENYRFAKYLAKDMLKTRLAFYKFLKEEN